MKKSESGLGLTVIGLLLAVLSFFPVYFSLISAFKSNGEIMRDPVALPTGLRLDNFVYLWQHTRYPAAFLRSSFLTLASIVLIILVIPIAAYILERKKVRFSGLIYIYFIAGMMIPFQAYMIPLFRQLKVLGLFGNMAGPIVIYVAGSIPFGTLLYASFIKGIPKEVEEAAVIDGCNTLQTFWKIVFPLLTPCTASLIILNGMSIWNDFLMPMLVLPSSQAKTVNVEIFAFVDQYASRWDVVFAGTFCSIIPVLIAFVALQQYFVKGITAGTVKG